MQHLEALQLACVLEGADVDRVEPAGGDEFGDLCDVVPQLTEEINTRKG
ncbi:hypothetical protein ACWD26_42210 [Streptomyces sp. NPDC002787]